MSSIRAPSGCGEVDRDSAVDHVLNAGFVEAVDDLVPSLGLHRDGQVVESAEHLGVRADVEPGESKKASRLPLPMSKKKCVEPG